MAEQSQGSNTDTDRLQREITELQRLDQLPFASSAFGYIKRTGPGLLQSAMTLGAGSAAASVIAGASFGYKLLWVQPVAMFLGVMMLGALSNVVLTTGERPYKSFGREIGKWLVILWALGTIMASVIWHFPQYGLAASAARDLGNLQGVISVPVEVTEANTLLAAAEKTKDKPQINQAKANLNQVKKDTTLLGLGYTNSGLMLSFGVGILILCINIVATFNYGGDSRGVRIYEWFLRGCIALVIVMFGIVVVAKFDVVRAEFGEICKGLFGWYGIPNLWNLDGTLNNSTVTQVLGMLGAAVGINMTFLYPYSLLKKGWGKHHKKLARWDLGMTMFLPFVMVTSLVIIAMKVGGVYSGADVVNTTMQPLEAAGVLSGVLGDNMGRIVFNLGLIGMTCGAISTHMVVCGFTFCEMLGLEQTKSRFRLFSLTPAIGILGVIASLPMWFPVAASAVCFTMLPIAYLAFLIMNNKRSYIGDAVGHGFSRLVFNVILVIALAVATIGSGIKIYSNVVKKILPAKEVTATALVLPTSLDVQE
ncbi:divalent metal cation transporter [Bythopirellula polymerisocia]|uniref:Manganese transport protein MntH n=1 Tax=Bythopirellula polymerisocia TaxID=2528003 RepID=A0A5C6CPB3_9BACT|nr:divalent metal cation transporter [Bythopirellula polymerisocia]TWU24569.1 manganese transport protein MntH [Bythopirellula polymerisocia]